jgi:hypothetical protein
VTRIRTDPAVAGSTAYHRTSEIIQATLRAYDLSGTDFTDAVRLLRSTFDGCSGLEIDGGFGAPRDAQQPWEQCGAVCRAAALVVRNEERARCPHRDRTGSRLGPDAVTVGAATLPPADFLAWGGSRPEADASAGGSASSLLTPADVVRNRHRVPAT